MNNEDMRILYNAILIVCWTALAIAFGKWYEERDERLKGE